MHEIQSNILRELEQQSRTYSELYRSLEIRSNRFNYHLKRLVAEGVVVKSQDKYFLSSEGQSKVLYLDISPESQPLTIVVLKINYNGKLILIRRDKEAFKGYLAMPGGKIHRGETVDQAIARILYKETGLVATNSNYLATVQERVLEDGFEKHHFILLLHEVAVEGKLRGAEAYLELPEKVVPSDLEMLKLSSKFATSVIRCNNGRLEQEIFSTQ